MMQAVEQARADFEKETATHHEHIAVAGLRLTSDLQVFRHLDLGNQRGKNKQKRYKKMANGSAS